MIWSLGYSKKESQFFEETLDKQFRLRHFRTFEELKNELKENELGKNGDIPRLLIAGYRAKSRTAIQWLKQKDRRPELKNCHVLVISNVDSCENIQECLEAGAIDYLLWPVSKNMLLAKVRHIIKYSRKPSIHLPENASLQIVFDNIAHCVRVGSKEVELTRKEAKIFNALYRAGSDGMSRTELCHITWSGVAVTPKALDVHLFNLRRKIRILGLEVRFVGPERYYLVMTE